VKGKTGFIDKTGKVVVPPEFASAYPFSEGLAAVSKSSSVDDGWGYIDKTGKWVIVPQFQRGGSFQEHLARVKRGDDCGYIDPAGAFVLQPAVSPGENGCALVWGDFADGLSRSGRPRSCTSIECLHHCLFTGAGKVTECKLHLNPTTQGQEECVAQALLPVPVVL
jgi:hypothetical protein